MKKLQASNDKNAYAKVDDDIAEIIKDMGLKFCINHDGRFISTTKIQLSGMTENKYLLLHRFIWILKTGTEPELTVDHLDIDPLNNQFKNLRLASRKEQNQHRGKMKNNKSGYIGVCYKHDVDNRRNKKYENDYWLASIHKPDGHREAKLFPYTETGKIAAAKYYDSKARAYFGEFAVTNFPDENR